MEALDIARRLAELGETAEAQKAYALVLHENGGQDPQIELEAALYLLTSEGDWDYRVPYASLVGLYNSGHFQSELLDILVQAFYEPNLEEQRKRYKRNRHALEGYPYFFCEKPFPDFDELPVKFFPYDDNGYLPFPIQENRFLDYMDPSYPVIGRNFFQDLAQPVFASDVFSQYELEYLNDNVRPSEWCARENHIYLHYTDWVQFCAWLSVLELSPLLKSKKIVFLIEEERTLYPIDFKQRFGIDYERFQLRPFAIGEVQRLIWHTQLSYHNGGDFFNEVFHGHPYLMVDDSLLAPDLIETIDQIMDMLQTHREKLQHLRISGTVMDARLVRKLAAMKAPTRKDALVFLFLGDMKISQHLDPRSRIAPVLFLQPHFHHVDYSILTADRDRAVLYAESYETICKSGLLDGFKYIKTFTPLRRISNSYAASVHYGYYVNYLLPREEGETGEGMIDLLAEQLVNRSCLVDPKDPHFIDSRVVRYEDAKLEPKATFTALAAFLDVPYTESMNECTGPNAVEREGKKEGFSTEGVYRTYDEYACPTERYLIEYFMRDVYERYGYDFLFYDGAPVDESRIEELLMGCTTLDSLIRETTYQSTMSKLLQDGEEERTEEQLKGACTLATELQINECRAARRKILRLLMNSKLHFVNREGQPLQLMELLQLDPELMEGPLYH